MIRRTYKVLIHLLGGLAAALTILLVFAVWHLSQGPVSLAFLTPYVEDILATSHKSFRLKLDDTILTWGGWNRAFDIRVINARAMTPDGVVMAQIPEMSMSLSTNAMVRGLLAPETIELFRPSLYLIRRQDGTFALGFEQKEGPSTELVARIFSELVSSPDPDNAMSYLSRVNIIKAGLTIEDQQFNSSWHSSSADIKLVRNKRGIKGEASLDLFVDGKQTQFTILGDYHAKDKRLDFGVAFNDLRPSIFSRVTPEFSPLEMLNLSLKGTVTVSMIIDGTLEMVGFDISGGQGRISFPNPVAQNFEVKDAQLSGRYEGSSDTLEIVNLSLNLGENGSLLLPAPIDHRFPVKSIKTSASYSPRRKRLEIKSFEAGLPGPKASLRAIAEGIGGDVSINVGVDLQDIPGDKLGDYWPRAWGTNAQAWSVKHLSKGILRDVKITADLLAKSDGDLSVRKINGEMILEGHDVNYYTPMPVVRNVWANATFDEKRIDFKILKGESEGLKIKEGTIAITGLDEYDQYADIDLMIDGPVRNAVSLINHDPLKFADKIGITPEQTDGDSSTQLSLNFIVEHSLTMERINVSATSKVKDVTLKGVILGRNITEGNLRLDVDKEGMNVGGDVKFGPIEASLVWRENFGKKVDFRSQYWIQGRIGDTQRTTELGFDFPPFWGEVVKGTLEADIRFTVVDKKRSRMQVKLDLIDADLALPKLGWTKPPGVAGTAEVDLSLLGEEIKEVSRFTINAGDLSAIGSVRYATDGSGLERIDLDKFSYGRTNVKGSLIPGKDDGWTVSVHGGSFDMVPLKNELLSSDAKKGKIGSLDSISFSLSADLNEVWLGEEHKAENVVGTFIHGGNIWKRMRVTGFVEKNKAFELSIEPKGTGKRTFNFFGSDAGSTLRAFGVYDPMIGGILVAKGEFDDTVPNSPLKGKLQIEDYRVIDAPALAHIVSIMAITGLLDTLQGEGMGFRELEAPFTYRDGVIELEDARAWGASLGYTAKGKIYVHAEALDIEGTMVPAYALNSVLGFIPILGDILTGGEEGGGIFAVRFRMTGAMEDPKISMNPLSALAPGFLRNIFGFFDSPGETPETPEGVDRPASEGLNLGNNFD